MRTRPAKPAKLIRLIFGAIGLLMCVFAGWLQHSTATFVASASRTQGEVVKLLYVESSHHDSSGGTWRPLVRFKAPAGQIIEFTPSSSSSPPAYQAGESVEVFFNPSNPQDARLNGFFALWGGAAITGGLGLVFLLVAIGMTFLPDGAAARHRHPR